MRSFKEYHEFIERCRQTLSLVRESPIQIHSPFDWLEDSKRNKGIYNICQQANPIQLETNLYVSSTQLGTIFYSLSQSQQDPIDFLLVLNLININPLGIVPVQTSIWKRAGYNFSARRIFWQYAIKLKELIVSDNKQTRNGKDFWLRRLNEAASNGYKCYAIDTIEGVIYSLGSTPANEALKYYTNDAIEGASDEEINKVSNGLRYRICISKDDLQ